MYISCPVCRTRFKFDEQKVSTAGVKLRCSRCSSVFRLAAEKGERPGRLTVLVAHESGEFCAAVQKVLAPEPFDIISCHDGKEALDLAFRFRPDVVILNVALPTMYGFQVCEALRGDSRTSDIKIILLAAIYDKTKYKRSPQSLYGADDYIEQHHIPDSLAPMIYRLASGAKEVEPGNGASVENDIDTSPASFSPAEASDQEKVRKELMANQSAEVPAETDAAFERMATTILQHHRTCHFACASHNIRSIAAVLEIARSLEVPDSRYEFQMLYGMAEPVRRAILAASGRVRLYCPFGEMVPGMGYLVRRLLENTSNESFLRINFSGKAGIERSLEDPEQLLLRHRQQGAYVGNAVDSAVHPAFRNEPAADFTRADIRAAFPAALAVVRGMAGRIVPLLIDGKDIVTSDTLPSRNPNRPSEIIGNVCQAGTVEVEQAIAAAAQAFPAWSTTPAIDRAACLQRAATLARQQLFELAACQVLEIGKQWDQAHADVAEAIDFLEYYAAEMLRVGKPRRIGDLPGEENILFYEGRGVAAVIAPWNFPLAIACGMVSAALVTGNTVVFKPSGLTSVTGRMLVELFQAAGLPDGVLNFVPGRGDRIGLLLDRSLVQAVADPFHCAVGDDPLTAIEPFERQRRAIRAKVRTVRLVVRPKRGCRARNPASQGYTASRPAKSFVSPVITWSVGSTTRTYRSSLASSGVVHRSMIT